MRSVFRTAGRVGSAVLPRVSKWAGNQLKKSLKRKMTRKAAPRKRVMPVRPMEADNDHSGKTTTKHVIVLGKGRKGNMKKTYGHFTYHQQNSESISCQTGQQTIASMGTDFTTQQVGVRTGAAHLDPAPNDYYYGLMTLNPNKRASGDGSGLIPAGTNLETTKIFVKGVSYDFQIGNMTTVPVDVILYAVTPRVACSWSESYNQLTDGALDDAQSIIDNYSPAAVSLNPTDAGGVQTAGVFGKPALNHYGFTPFELSGFRKMYRRVFTKEINLAAGAFHKFEVRVALNKTFDEEVMETLRTETPLSTGLKGASINWFCILRGSPVIVKDAGGIPFFPNTSVTTSSAEIAWTCTRKITGHFYSGATIGKVDYATTTFRVLSGTTTAQQMDAEDTQIPQVYVT